MRARYSCQDATGAPGIGSCTAPVRSGSPVNTHTLGRPFAVTATSKDGQRITKTVSYTVTLPNNKFTISHLAARPDGIVTFELKLPGPGRVDVLETAWNDNFAPMARLLDPAPFRFVFARAHRHVGADPNMQVRVMPNQRGQRLVEHYRYKVRIRLWVSYTPSGGHQHDIGIYGVRISR